MRGWRMRLHSRRFANNSTQCLPIWRTLKTYHAPKLRRCGGSVLLTLLSYLWTQTRMRFQYLRHHTQPRYRRVELPFSTSDRPLERDAKLQANRLDGFSVSADMLFDSTGPIDPNSVNTDTIQLWDIGQTPIQVPISVRVMAESGEAPCWETPISDACRHVVISLDEAVLPLENARSYAVVVTSGLTGANGSTRSRDVTRSHDVPEHTHRPRRYLRSHRTR